MKYSYLSSICGATASVVILSGNATAATFSGYDRNTTGTPINIQTLPNSSAKTAFTNFSSNLNGATVTTESFENNAAPPNGTPINTPIDGLTTLISGTTATFSYKKSDNSSATTAGSSTRVQLAGANGNPAGFTNSGTYPTDGSRSISINSANNFSISFNNLLAAFSYFGTDLGDFSNTLTMKFFNGANEVSSTPIPTNIGSSDSSLFFFGFIANSPAQYFDKVAFVNSASGDAIGIDQITIATPAQTIAPTAIPEPATILGTLLFGGAVVAIKRQQQQAKS